MHSFTITGYSCFDHLEIPRLARVNLVTGRNGSGKSALLEAFALYADSGAWESLLAVLSGRNWLRPEDDPWVVAVRHLPGNGDSARGPVRHRGGATLSAGGGATVVLQCGWITADGGGVQLTDEVESRPSPRSSHAYFARVGSTIVQEVREIGRGGSRSGGAAPEPLIRHVLVPLAGIPSAAMSGLWSRLAFTAAARSIRTALQTLRADIEEVGFDEVVPGGERFAVVKLAGEDGAVPMASLGDGVLRAFGLLLALYTARGGLLLVDEIDTGLHFRVMQPLFALLLAEAERADVQVVATTHSQDAIRSLARAARELGREDAAFLRLEASGVRRQAFLFDGDVALELLADEQLEVR